MTRLAVQNRRLSWATWLLLAAAVALYLPLLSNELGDVWMSDCPLYLTLAKALAGGLGYCDIHLPGQPPELLVPFGFPLLLSLVMRLTGEVLWPLHLLLIAHLWVALWCVTRWWRQMTGRQAGGLLLVGLTTIHPRLVEWSLTIMPIFPYLCYSLIALLCIERYVQAGDVASGWYWAGLLGVLAAIFCWLPGIALGASAVLALLTAGPQALRRRKAGWMAAGIALPVGAWLLRSWWLEQLPVESALQALYVNSGHVTYWHSMLSKVHGPSPAGAWTVGNHLLSAARFYTTQTAQLLAPGSWAVLGWGLLACVVLGWVHCWRRGLRMSEWYLLAYGLLFFINPHRGERYLLPILPFLYAYALWGLGVCGEFGQRWVADDPRLRHSWPWLARGAGLLLVGALVAQAAGPVAWRLRSQRLTLHLPGQTSTINWAHFIELRMWQERPDVLALNSDVCDLHLWVRRHDATDAIVLSYHPRLGAWLSGHPALRWEPELGWLEAARVLGARYLITMELPGLVELYRSPPVAQYLSGCRVIEQRSFATLYALP